MNAAQMIEEQQYSNAARFERFEGFDRGDNAQDDRDQGSECIGRQHGESGGKVEIFRDWDGDFQIFAVVVTGADGHVSTFNDFPEGRAAAVACARWWLAGCPA